MSKINPGSNVYGDNDVQTARPGSMQETVIAEPTIDDKSKLHCPLCDRVFNSREDYLSHAFSKHQNDESNYARKLLETFPYDKGFHFFVAEGQYTGETAVSLAAFAKEVDAVQIESINFHFKRADFQKWIETTIGDNELAAAIDTINKEITGESLRRKLLMVINARVNELENQA